MNVKTISWAGAIVVLALAGCGSSDSNDPGSVAIPVTSSADFTTFVGSRTGDDLSEPLDIETLMPPTSETAEPIDVT